jgi:hypothetical protein
VAKEKQTCGRRENDASKSSEFLHWVVPAFVTAASEAARH